MPQQKEHEMDDLVIMPSDQVEVHEGPTRRS